jgi:predicted metal-dependent phosphoesterase TrpH
MRAAGLKADLHVHTREAEPPIKYSAREVIDRAAREGFRVLGITNHDAFTYDDALVAYVGVDKLQTFADLRRYRTPDWLVIAPHPFFPTSYCLRDRLWQEIELFDAIEFSHFYTPRIDFNRPAVKLAAAVGLPLVGTSDCHLHEQFGTTFSLIDAEPSVESVLSAIKKGRVSVVSRPLSLTRCASIVIRQALAAGKAKARTRMRPSPPPQEAPASQASASARS